MDLEFINNNDDEDDFYTMDDDIDNIYIDIEDNDLLVPPL